MSAFTCPGVVEYILRKATLHRQLIVLTYKQIGTGQISLG